MNLFNVCTNVVVVGKINRSSSTSILCRNTCTEMIIMTKDGELRGEKKHGVLFTES